MTIYERPTKALMTDWAKETLQPGQTFTKFDPARWFAEHYPRINRNTVGMHVEIMSINNRIRKHYPSIKPGSGHDLFYKLGSNEYRLWDRNSDPSPRYKQNFENEEYEDSTNSVADDVSKETNVEATKRKLVKGNAKQQASNVDLLIGAFSRYLRIFERNPPFRRYGQLEYHAETIERRRELGSAAKALIDDQFIAALYKTLQAWGIGVRASKLRPLDEFGAALRAQSSLIIALEGKTIDDPTMNVNETGQQIWRLIDALDIVANNTRIVAGSKALHHVLPELIVPIDRAYTQKFFCWQSSTFQYDQRSCFEQAFVGFTQIARQINPSQYVIRGWNSSRTKVIDNALVGFISDQQAARGQRNTENNDLIEEDLPAQLSTPTPLTNPVVRWFRRLFS